MRAGPAAVGLGLCLLAPGVAGEAVLLELGAPERSEAIQLGQRSVTQETFDAEWSVADGTGSRVKVLSLFHQLVLAARHAAFKNEPLSARDEERLLRQQGERLVIWAYLKGPREDFARYFAPRLIAGDREIEPAFVQNERTALREEDGRYLARCVYGFPTRNLPPRARVELVVRNIEGRAVNRFTIDLAKMR